MIGAIALVWALLLLAVPAIAALRARRLLRDGGPGRGATGDAVLIRPVAGDEPGLAARLAMLPPPVASVLLAVESPGDAGYAAARAAAERLGPRARVIETGGGGPNHKAAQLEVALAATDAAVIVVADADVDLAGVRLDGLLGALEGADAAWAPPVELAPRTSADRASSALLTASLHAFPLLCGIDPRGLVGKLFAVRREALVRAGSFAALADRLGEDVELARRLGGRVRPAPLVARSTASGRSWREAIDRYARWLFVIRGQRPHLLLGYPLVFLGTWPVLLLAAIGAPAPEAIAAAVVAAGARLFTAAAAHRLSGLASTGPVRWAADAVRGDALLAAALVRNLAARSFEWRGRRLRIRGGRLLLDHGGGT